MTLLDTLGQSLAGEHGFSLSGTTSAVGTSLGDVSPTGAALDTSALSGIAQRLGSGDLGAIAPAMEAAVTQAGSAGVGLPDPASLLRPLTSALDAGEAVISPDTRQALRSLEQAGAAERAP